MTTADVMYSRSRMALLWARVTRNTWGTNKNPRINTRVASEAPKLATISTTNKIRGKAKVPTATLCRAWSIALPE